MNTTIRKFSRKAAFLGILLASINVAAAQTVSTTTSMSSAGTVQEFTPNTFTVTSASSSAPMHYTYSKTTTYVDENGNPVSMETVKSGLPVTVFYDRNGDQMVANKVVVKKHVDVNADGSVSRESSTTTTTSSQGTVSSFSPDAIAINPDGSTTPTSYGFSKTVTYVDQNGNTISSDTVRAGTPVTVFYDHDGDRVVATRVMVRAADPAIIEQKKTTTTTTQTTPNP